MLSVRDAAALTGLGRKTLHRLIQAGKIPAFKMTGHATRIRSVDLERYMEQVRTSRRSGIAQARAYELSRKQSPAHAFLECIMAAATRRDPLPQFAPNPDSIPQGAVLLANGPVIYAYKIEPDCVCGHAFSVHRHASGDLAVTHACTLCDCQAWCSFHTKCLWCGSPLAADACSTADIMYWSPRQETWLYGCVSQCGKNPDGQAWFTKEKAYAVGDAEGA